MLFPERDLVASPHPLMADAVARLNWGRQHISRYMRVMHLYLRTPGQRPHPEDEALFITLPLYEDRAPLPDYAHLTFADALAALRSSLDLAVFSLANAYGSGVEEKNRLFPVRKSRRDLAKSVAPYADIPGFPEMMLDEIRPYLRDEEGYFGNPFLWALNELNNISKHRRPSILVQRSKRTGTQDANGNLYLGDFEIVHFLDEPAVLSQTVAESESPDVDDVSALKMMHESAADAIRSLARLLS